MVLKRSDVTGATMKLNCEENCLDMEQYTSWNYSLSMHDSASVTVLKQSGETWKILLYYCKTSVIRAFSFSRVIKNREKIVAVARNISLHYILSVYYIVHDENTR